MHAYNKLYGLRPDIKSVGLPGVASYEVHGSLSDSTESLPLPPSLPCHARHKEVSGELSGDQRVKNFKIPTPDIICRQTTEEFIVQ